jgi:YebC/PmpR family DNA-binding regulatory protein
MSGHSKWATIKRKKGAKDAARGKVFSKLIKEITIAARHGGGDPAGNPRLRTAIEAAKAENMPGTNIDRAVKRGTGELEGVTYEEITYEGYGPGGIAVLVEAATDNRVRTVGEIRHVFAKGGGNMAEAGAVSWMFHSRGLIVVERSAMDEEKLMDLALEAGADDVNSDGSESYEIITSLAGFDKVRKALESAGVATVSAELAKVPQNTVAVSEKDAPAVLRLIDALEEHDDVQKVYANFQIADDVLTRLAG